MFGNNIYLKKRTTSHFICNSHQNYADTMFSINQFEKVCIIVDQLYVSLFIIFNF